MKRCYLKHAHIHLTDVVIRRTICLPFPIRLRYMFAEARLKFTDKNFIRTQGERMANINNYFHTSVSMLYSIVLAMYKRAPVQI